jgi:hypothetical protein
MSAAVCGVDFLFVMVYCESVFNLKEKECLKSEAMQIEPKWIISILLKAAG